MDADRICLCGEESFGTGSNHIREKDGMWAALCWLSILAEKYLEGNQTVTVRSLVEQHWAKFGRNVFTRYDYENCEADACDRMIQALERSIVDQSLIGRKFNANEYGSEVNYEYRVQQTDNFEYIDPVDHSVTKKQGEKSLKLKVFIYVKTHDITVVFSFANRKTGIRVLFGDGARIIVRLSGTGSQGATVRLYVDAFVQETDRLILSAAELLKPLIAIALQITQIQQHTGRDRPTVIT